MASLYRRITNVLNNAGTCLYDQRCKDKIVCNDLTSFLFAINHFEKEKKRRFNKKNEKGCYFLSISQESL